MIFRLRFELVILGATRWKLRLESFWEGQLRSERGAGRGKGGEEEGEKRATCLFKTALNLARWKPVESPRDCLLLLPPL